MKPTLRKAHLHESLLVLLARLSDVLSPAEKDELQRAISILRAVEAAEKELPEEPLYVRCLRVTFLPGGSSEEIIRHIDALRAYAVAQKADIEAAQRALAEERERAARLPRSVVAMCANRGWSMHWTHRGAYLHLESSELIEAIRGKHGDPLKEAADVLLVLMSITEHVGIPWGDVLKQAEAKVAELMVKPHYPGEEYAEGQASSGAEPSQEDSGPASPAPDALVEEIAREIANEYRRKEK